MKFNFQLFLEKAQLIETTEHLERFLSENSSEEIFAVDTESAGFFKYYSVVNLIQVATRRQAAIIDPQSVKNFEPLREFARNSKQDWIFHGADYDARVLHRDFKVAVPSIFDTRVAAQFLGLQELGLSSLAERYLGFSLDKKLQRCDWSRRPLTSEMRKYALLDAICLVPIMDFLRRELTEKGRLSWVLEEFDALRQFSMEEGKPELNPFGFLIKGSNLLSMASLAVLREIWLFREKIAQGLDRAPYMVLGNQTLLDIARKSPRTMAGLSIIKGMGEGFLSRYGRQFLEAIQKGCETNPESIILPQKSMRSQNFLTSWEGQLSGALRDVRNAIATELNLPGSLIASGHSLEILSKDRPQSIDELRAQGILRNWQADLMEKKIMPLLQKSPPASPQRRRRHRRSKGPRKE